VLTVAVARGGRDSPDRRRDARHHCTARVQEEGARPAAVAEAAAEVSSRGG
jgi:hypothetical protein